MSGPTIDEAIALVAHAREVAGHSAGTSRLDAWVLRAIGVPPQDATVLDLERVILRSKNRGTRATYANRIRSVFDLLNRLGAINNRAHEQLPRLSMPETQPRPLSDEQVRRLLDGMREPHVDTVRVALLTGARSMEVWAMAGTDLLHGPNGPELLLHGKGGTELTVPAHPTVVDVFERYATLGRLFTRYNTSHQLSQRVGEEMRRVLGTHVEFHQCRHTFGTRVYQATGDIYLTSRVLRHASVATTQVYAQIADSRPREAILGLAG